MRKSFRPERLLYRNVRIRGPRGVDRRRIGRRHSSALFGLAAAFGVTSTLSLALLAPGVALAATASVNLATASPFAVLAGSTITNTGSSVVAGDVGLSPGTSITGFPPGTQSSGTTFVADAQAQGAQSDLTAAYLDAAGRTPFTAVTGDLGGSTLVAGVYQSSSSLALTGTLTLNGQGDSGSVFVLQAGSTLTTASGSSVVLENGAQACNVFWQVGTSATLGTTSNFSGTILALTSITLNTGASVSGRALARNGAVTLDDNSISVPTCSAASTTTTTLGSTTTTTPPATTTTTTTPPATTTTTVSSTTTTPPTTTTTVVIPIGSPQTGFGGTAGPGPRPWTPIGLAALALALLFVGLAVLTRRRHPADVHERRGGPRSS